MSATTVRTNTLPANSYGSPRKIANYGHRYGVDFYVLYEVDGQLYDTVYTNVGQSVLEFVTAQGATAWLAEKL